MKKLIDGVGIVLTGAALVAAAGCAEDEGDPATTAQVHKTLASGFSGNTMTVALTKADGSVAAGAEVSPDVWQFDAAGGGALKVEQKVRENPAAGLTTHDFRFAGVRPGELIEMEGEAALPEGCSCRQTQDLVDPSFGTDLRVVSAMYFNPTPRSEDNYQRQYVDDGASATSPALEGTPTSYNVKLFSCAGLGYDELIAKALIYRCP